MATSQAPLKVLVETKRMLVWMSALLGCTQNELAQRALEEYFLNHSEELGKRHEEIGRLIKEMLRSND